MIAQLQPVLMTPATMAIASVCRERGKGCPNASATTVRIPATANARSNASTNGGMSAMPILIAAHVDPQTRTTAAYAAITLMGGMRHG